MIKVDDFCKKLEDIAKFQKTIYIKGCFGAPMNVNNKKRYTSNLEYNKNRSGMINACSADTFGFDCVNLVKAILWGWDGNKNKNYGGATYKSNGVPDTNADGMINLCDKVSKDFTNIQKGELVWMSGHVGVYLGDGRVVECTPKWTNNVQITNLGNLGYKTGHYRNWTSHGFLPWVDYDKSFRLQIINKLLYIRTKPSTVTGVKIGKVYKGDIVQIEEINSKGTWGRIKGNGWISIKDKYVNRL